MMSSSEMEQAIKGGGDGVQNGEIHTVVSHDTISVQTALVFTETSVFSCHRMSQRRHHGGDEALTH